MICFEFPIIERVRTFLRLEDLYQRLEYWIKQDCSIMHDSALHTLFELMECASRADLKSDILQELERQRQQLEPLKGNPAIDENTLYNTLFELSSAAKDLLGIQSKFAQHLRENEWLMLIKQRMVVPGGTCQFDLPSYHFWLKSSTEARQADLYEWSASLKPTYTAVALLLKILRDSGSCISYVAKDSSFQQASVGSAVQLLRITLDEVLNVLPEVSANKYMTNIRFITASTKEVHGKKAEIDVPFEIMSCKF